MPYEYLAHQVAKGYQGMTWAQVFYGDPARGMSYQELLEAAAFFGLDADREEAAESKSSAKHAGKAPKRSMLHKG